MTFIFSPGLLSIHTVLFETEPKHPIQSYFVCWAKCAGWIHVLVFLSTSEELTKCSKGTKESKHWKEFLQYTQTNICGKQTLFPMPATWLIGSMVNVTRKTKNRMLGHKVSPWKSQNVQVWLVCLWDVLHSHFSQTTPEVDLEAEIFYFFY